MPKILISDSLSPRAVEIFNNRGLEVDVKTDLSPDELIACIAEYEGLAVRSATKVTPEVLAAAKNLKVVSDVNAVPPPGIEGLEVNSNGEKIKNTNVLGIGALAVGQIKAQVQHKLLKLMCSSDKPVFLDFREAYKIAQDIKK